MKEGRSSIPCKSKYERHVCLCSTSLIWSGQQAKGSPLLSSRLKLKALNYTQLQAHLTLSNSLSCPAPNWLTYSRLPRRTWQSTKGRRKCNFKQTAIQLFIISRLFSSAECSSFADDDGKTSDVDLALSPPSSSS